MKLQQWDEYESLRDECISWLKETDSFIHSIDLKPTLGEKLQQSEQLKVNIILIFLLFMRIVIK